MSFFNQLCEQTRVEQQHLLLAPAIEDALQGRIQLNRYIAFLTEAYHHVKHTVPLLMAAGARMTDHQEWLRAAIVEYIDEEYGHHEWILNDIVACGGDADAVRQSQPHFTTELMISFVYDQINRNHPASFFGMAHVLEGTSVALASHAAEQIQQQLGLPKRAFTYLNSHGALDQEHVAFFAELMDKLTDPLAQQAIVHTAKGVYHLYGDMFRALPE
jgi:pyrroloquinoline quinone (PQQ) biosynthesis protein C